MTDRWAYRDDCSPSYRPMLRAGRVSRRGCAALLCPPCRPPLRLPPQQTQAAGDAAASIEQSPVASNFPFLFQNPLSTVPTGARDHSQSQSTSHRRRLRFLSNPLEDRAVLEFTAAALTRIFWLLTAQ